VLIPAMVKEGYDKNFTVAVTACSAVMGVIIPPSITMVVWGGVMSTSVSGLFLAGFIPGVMIAGFQMILVLIYAWKRKYPTTAGFSLKEVGISFKDSLLALFTPLIIVGGIVGGLFTPTEASLIAVLYSLILGLFIARTLAFRDVSPLLLQTAKLSSIVLFAVGTASIYAWVLAYFKIPQFLIDAIGSLTTSPTIMLFIFVIIFLIVGTFMDAVPAIVILGPLFKPLAEFVGIHPLHFAIVGVVTLAFGLVTPPYGLCLLIASEIAEINCMRAIKEVGAFLLVMLLVLVLIVIFQN
jgi:tripartite ATP-independent transporter DctM subunit